VIPVHALDGSGRALAPSSATIRKLPDRALDVEVDARSSKTRLCDLRRGTSTKVFV